MLTDEVKTEHSDHNHQRYIWRKKKEQYLIKRKPCQLLSIGVALLSFGVVWQQVAQELHHDLRRMDSSKYQ